MNDINYLGEISNVKGTGREQESGYPTTPMLSLIVNDFNMFPCFLFSTEGA